MRPKVLLTNRIDPSGERIIESVADIVLAQDTKPETLYRMVTDADVLVVRAYLPGDLFEHPNRLRGIVRHGVGLDMIPMEAANAHAIPVANVPGSNAEAVAEYAIASFLLLLRHIHKMDRELRTLDWATSRKRADTATELFGKTVGIVGVGSVGERVAEICHTAFRMRVLGYQRRLDALPGYVEGVALDKLFQESDLIFLSCPLTPETRHLVNQQRLSLMKSSAFIINAARGPVIDEDALVAALRERRIGGAALDVYDVQPLPRDHPLLELDNVVLTPHAAGITQESMWRMSQGAAQEVLRLLAGEKPHNFVNPEVWERHLARLACSATRT
jgi:D-3-phosphoglycerate dehydrogenase / 2-oxoglutarate reductase